MWVASLLRAQRITHWTVVYYTTLPTALLTTLHYITDCNTLLQYLTLLSTLHYITDYTTLHYCLNYTTLLMTITTLHYGLHYTTLRTTLHYITCRSRLHNITHLPDSCLTSASASPSCLSWLSSISITFSLPSCPRSRNPSIIHPQSADCKMSYSLKYYSLNRF